MRRWLKTRWWELNFNNVIFVQNKLLLENRNSRFLHLSMLLMVSVMIKKKFTQIRSWSIVNSVLSFDQFYQSWWKYKEKSHKLKIWKKNQRIINLENPQIRIQLNQTKVTLTNTGTEWVSGWIWWARTAETSHCVLTCSIVSAWFLFAFVNVCKF